MGVDCARRSLRGLSGGVGERRAASNSRTPCLPPTSGKPKDDAEWTIVRRNALLMLEGANLIVMDGRHVAKPGQKPGVGELPHAEIEIRMNKDRAVWNKLAMEFSDAAKLALDAAEKKDAEALFAVGADVDMGCENCHLRFWYPDQDKLFAK